MSIQQQHVIYMCWHRQSYTIHMYTPHTTEHYYVLSTWGLRSESNAQGEITFIYYFKNSILKPPTGSSWSCPGTARGQPALSSFSEEEKSMLWRYSANREAGGSSWHRHHHVLVWGSGVDCSAVPYRKQSYDNRSLFSSQIGWDVTRAFVTYNFTARLSKQQLRQIPWCQRSF